MADKKAAASAPSGAGSASGDAAITMSAVTSLKIALAVLTICVLGLLIDTVYLAVTLEKDTDSDVIYVENALTTRGPPAGDNPCEGIYPIPGFENF
eukprot:scaffold7021_cov162-Pinguiococcus_pyrenoidosus.AAC.1